MWKHLKAYVHFQKAHFFLKTWAILNKQRLSLNVRCNKWLGSPVSNRHIFYDICDFLYIKHKYLKTRGHSCPPTQFAQHLWHVSSFSPEGCETAWTGFCEIPAARCTIFLFCDGLLAAPFLPVLVSMETRRSVENPGVCVVEGFVMCRLLPPLWFLIFFFHQALYIDPPLLK